MGTDRWVVDDDKPIGVIDHSPFTFPLPTIQYFLYFYPIPHFMRFLSPVLSFLRNKFFLSATAFVIWMLFFDRNDLFSQMERRSELREIRESKAYFEEQIAENRNFSKDLQFNAEAIEKYARENYLMKRENEDLFLIKPIEKK